MKHPSDKRGIGRKSSGGKGSNPKGGKFPKTQPPLRAPDSAVPTTPPSNVTAAPGLGPARERAGACQAPDPRHC
eukprot:scaffold1223_cov136-Isochrysis_galbana.AAC.3